MPNFPNLTLLQKHFNDVESYFHGGIFYQSQIIQPGAGQTPASLGIHGGGGADPIFGGASLHFDKYEAIALVENQVDFTALSAEIGSEKL